MALTYRTDKKAITIVVIRSIAKKLCLAFFSMLLFILFSCKDDVLSPNENHAPGVSTNLIEIEMPGVLGITLNHNDVLGSRAQGDNMSSDNKPFQDGIASEYDLAAPDGEEFYHYLLLYKSTDSNDKPLVLPINIEGLGGDNDANITYKLTAAKIFTNSENNEIDDLKKVTLDQFKSYLSGRKPYVLLNFKLEDGQNSNYKGETIEGNTTAEKLANLTRSQLEGIQMKDYKIEKIKNKVVESDGGSGPDENGNGVEEVPAEKQSFFIMTNSVYSFSGAKTIDGVFDTNKIYTTVAQAVENPGLEVHVERIAAKVTVGFDIAKMSGVKFGPNRDQSLDYVTIGDNGLPEIHLKVDQVDMTTGNNNGIEFDAEGGYKIITKQPSATIKIIGYGLSNLEETTMLYKDINPSYNNPQWNWNDPNNHRSYWARDSHYDLVKGAGDNPNNEFTRVVGYVHQFRQALDTDSVTSYHNSDSGRSGYTYSDAQKGIEEYYVDDQKYTSFNNLGEINLESKRNDVYLRYKSFKALQEEFENYNSFKLVDRETGSGEPSGAAGDDSGKTTQVKEYTFYPLYTNENTYVDQGMLTNGQWRWEWQREPYAVATNLIVLAQIEIENNKDQGGNSDYEELRTVYLGQNNIFYLSKTNLLKSKLTILNKVMLEGGNAGLQILHGQWDRHIRWDDDDENQSSGETHLDKVAWNEDSKLWFGKVKWKYEAEDYEGPWEAVTEEFTSHDADGKEIKARRVVLEKVDAVPETDDVIKYLDLIPAEISGGDGQCLIAPHEDYMGRNWRYFLAPEKADGTMDRDNAVEISYNHLVALIHKIIGPVDVYEQGYMYFSVPIPHRIASYGYGTNQNQWKNLGSFSVVRNNWYNISVTEITRLGTPVQDLNQPIVPVMDVKRSYINMGVKLLNWHEIGQDNIPMM